MKRNVIITILIIFLNAELSVFAIPISEIRSLKQMCEADNLLIIRVPDCNSRIPSPNDASNYSVELLKDLKGGQSAGKTITVSVVQELTPGARYLLAGNTGYLRGIIPLLVFNWIPGIVEVPSNFKMSDLDDKDIPSQVVIILTARNREIEKRIEELNHEKKAIEKVLANNHE